MKKFLFFILFAAAGYFAWEYLIKEKNILEIKADKVTSTNFSMDIEAPALAPVTYGSIQGTVKNLSDITVSNILLKYYLDAKPVEALIYHLEPGEQKEFSTQNIIIRGAGVPFYLETLTYDEGAKLR